MEYIPPTYDIERFRRDTAEHQMTVLHDDGLYRHLRFAKPGTGMYWFEIVTWPGRLSVTGGFGSGYTFARLDDMFQFFRTGTDGINPHYWAEKIISGEDSVRLYSMDLFLQHVNEHVADAVEQTPELASTDDDRDGLAKAVENALNNEYNHHEYEESAQEFLRYFEYDYATEAGRPATWRFVDTYEWDLNDWSWSYLWACNAIRWGIEQYDKAKGAGTVVVELPAGAVA